MHRKSDSHNTVAVQDNNKARRFVWYSGFILWMEDGGTGGDCVEKKNCENQFWDTTSGKEKRDQTRE